MWVKVLLAWVLVVLSMAAGSSDWGQSTSSLRHQYPTLLQAEEEDWRAKRTGPSLSVSNPIEVLRNRLLLEIARRRLQKQGEQNREFLKNIGKRHTLTTNRLLDPLDQDLEGSDYLLSNSGEAWEAS